MDIGMSSENKKAKIQEYLKDKAKFDENGLLYKMVGDAKDEDMKDFKDNDEHNDVPLEQEEAKYLKELFDDITINKTKIDNILTATKVNANEINKTKTEKFAD